MRQAHLTILAWTVALASCARPDMRSVSAQDASAAAPPATLPGLVVAVVEMPCDDGNPCTDDHPNPVRGGCEHVQSDHSCTLPAGDCGRCLAGACQAGANTLIRRAYGVPGSTLRAGSPLADGLLLAGDTWQGDASAAWLVRTDACGEVVWQRSYRLAERDGRHGFQTVLALEDGTFLAGGHRAGPSTAASSTSPETDAWLLRVGADGHPLWQWHLDYLRSHPADGPFHGTETIAAITLVPDGTVRVDGDSTAWCGDSSCGAYESSVTWSATVSLDGKALTDTSSGCYTCSAPELDSDCSLAGNGFSAAGSARVLGFAANGADDNLQTSLSCRGKHTVGANGTTTPVPQVATAIATSGAGDIVVAGKGYVAGVGGPGQLAWSTTVPGEVHALAAVPGNEIVAGGRHDGGRLTQLDAGGQILASHSIGDKARAAVLGFIGSTDPSGGVVAAVGTTAADPAVWPRVTRGWLVGLLPDGSPRCAQAEDCADEVTCTTTSCTGSPGACTTAWNDLACDDANPCTVDTCGPAGCSHVHTAGPCDDGNACSTASQCSLGQCVATAVKACDDGNPCTDDSCNDETGACQYVANSAGCFAGCSVGKCSDGTCVVGDTAKLFTVPLVPGLPIVAWTVAQAVTAMPDGGIAWAAANHVVRYSADGSLLWHTTVGGLFSTDFIRDLAPAPDGGLLLVGANLASTATMSKDTAFLLDANGKELWSTGFDPGTSDGFELVAVEAGAVPGTFELLGVTKDEITIYDTAYATVRIRLTLPAKGVPQKPADVVTTHIAAGWADDLAALPAGGAWAAVGGALWRVLDSGEAKALELGAVVRAVDVAPDAGLAVVVDAPVGRRILRTNAAGVTSWQVDAPSSMFGVFADKTAVTVASFDGLHGYQDGHPAWAKAWPEGYPCATARMPDGGFALLTSAHLVRTDAWGHATCADAGLCAGIASCDDGNACTADVCEPNLGCVSKLRSEGSSCGGGKTCAGSKCL